MIALIESTGVQEEERGASQIYV